MALPATDAFTAASDAALQTYSSNWTINMGGFNVSAASDYVQSDTGDYSAAHWNADTFSADQYAQVKVSLRATSSDWVGPAVRAAASGGTFYGVFASTNYGDPQVFLSKLVSGSVTDLASVGLTLTAGDVIRLEVTGTAPATLTVKRNGTAITGLTSISDSSSPLTAGYAGFCCYAEPGDTATWMDDFEGGNLGGGAVDLLPVQVFRPRRYFTIDSWR
jgi:hypothetical protein